MKVDLHLHTTISDGRYTPEEVIHLAIEQGLTVIAITDHDSTDGIAAALEEAKSYPDLVVIPGVEISTDVPRGEVHILGYFIDYDSESFQRTLEVFRESRVIRAQKMVEKLDELGIHVDWERVLELAGAGAVGRPHIAQAMFEKGYIPSMQEAFIKYIGRDGPAYVEREKMTPVEAVELVIRYGGLPVLAHPADIDDLDNLLAALKKAGLVGMEVYYAGYIPEGVERLAQLAKKYDLIPCGGSDFHGFETGAGMGLGMVDVPEESAIRLIALAEKRNLVVEK